MLHEGIDRSATFRTLVDAIAASDGVVYIEFGYCAFGHLNGCLLPFVAASGHARYLRILVTPDPHQAGRDQLIALIGHELQHAREVLEHPEVVDVDQMLAMYRRLGSPLNDRAGYETSAARAAGDAIRAELSAK